MYIYRHYLLLKLVLHFSIVQDILFGLVKMARVKRNDLLVLITSATLNTDKFSTYFNNCPVLHIPGRVYPVEIYHSKIKQVMTRYGPSSNGYIQNAVDLCMQIHNTEIKNNLDNNLNNNIGHILIFMTGRDDIEKTVSFLREAAEKEGCLFDRNKVDRMHSNTTSTINNSSKIMLLIIPLYGALTSDEQQSAFEKVQGIYSSKGDTILIRKCIVATNIAETSITVPGVKYVVDAGYVKQKAYDPVRRIESLVVVPISKVVRLLVIVLYHYR
jgi:ATP-dependent RNA helicase DHX8/PRP22